MIVAARERVPELAFFALAIACAVFGYGTYRESHADVAPGPRDPSGLRVVTWNVGGSGGPEGHALVDKNLPWIAERLRSLDADVIVLQEVASRDQLQRLRALLGADETESTITAFGDRRIGVLARRGSLEAAEFRASRGRALAATYRQRGRAPVALVAVHADAYSAKQRNGEIGAALERLSRMNSAEAKILAGDFNLDLDLGKRRDLFTDDEHLDVETYNVVAKTLLDTAADAGPTAEPDRRLDYVFVSPDAFAVASARPWKGQRLGDMDHDPLVVDLKITRSTGR
ncbi:MAG: endonuclease/exonuclease/phosphatase family protein [Planctomycetes bacterium]|nr:endonuclease/exonuclease/phosphatase family protein [Planctomycetota bacterium]